MTDISPENAERLAKFLETVMCDEIAATLRAQAQRIVALEAALKAAKDFAKEMRKPQTLVGPPEYHGRSELMKAWVRTRYHAGKELHELIRTALEGKKP